MQKEFTEMCGCISTLIKTMEQGIDTVELDEQEMALFHDLQKVRKDILRLKKEDSTSVNLLVETNTQDIYAAYISYEDEHLTPNEISYYRNLKDGLKDANAMLSTMLSLSDWIPADPSITEITEANQYVLFESKSTGMEAYVCFHVCDVS